MQNWPDMIIGQTNLKKEFQIIIRSEVTGSRSINSYLPPPPPLLPTSVNNSHLAKTERWLSASIPLGQGKSVNTKTPPSQENRGIYSFLSFISYLEKGLKKNIKWNQHTRKEKAFNSSLQEFWRNTRQQLSLPFQSKWLTPKQKHSAVIHNKWKHFNHIIFFSVVL